MSYKGPYNRGDKSESEYLDRSNHTGTQPLSTISDAGTIASYNDTDFVSQDSNVGAAQLPTGTITQRPAVPVEGMFRRNSETGAFEGYDGASWSVIADSADTVLLTSDQTIAGVKTFTIRPNVNGDDVLLRPDIVGAVSQSGGVPTGAIIQRGSNANGEWVRYADGTQICTGQVVSSTFITEAVGQIWQSSQDTAWTYPSSFIGSPFISASTVSFTGGWVASGTLVPTNTTAYFRVMWHESLNNSPTFFVLAIGRWY